MTEERLSSLAMIKIHREMLAKLDFDKLVVDFANKHPRRRTLPRFLVSIKIVARCSDCVLFK